MKLMSVNLSEESAAQHQPPPALINVFRYFQPTSHSAFWVFSPSPLKAVLVTEVSCRTENSPAHVRERGQVEVKTRVERVSCSQGVVPLGSDKGV